MKLVLSAAFATLMLSCSTPVFAEHINEAYNGSTTIVEVSPNSSDTNTVDLSDTTSDTVYSPSFSNTTPAGQAPGQPIE